jgi:delta24-sterol reductase
VVKDKNSCVESIAIKDYLFRHDRGAFWMAGYGLYLPVLANYLLHKCGYPTRSLLPHVKPKNPGFLYRALFGWFLDSQSLYKSLHKGGESFFEQKVVVQDFYVSKTASLKWIKYVLNKYQITPLWICPVLSTDKPQIFSPHRTKKRELLFDIGVYGIPFGCSASEVVKDLESKTFEMGGKKMLYSQNYYTEEEFWEIYSKKDYDVLRTKYIDEFSMADITRKVLKI